MSVVEFARAALPVFLTLVGLTYFARFAGVYHRFGILSQASSNPGSTQHITHTLFGVFRAAIWLVVVSRLFFPQVDGYIGVCPALMQPGPVLAGMVLILAGFLLIAYVHNFMACDWRLGVAEDEAFPLLTSGPFARTRNPIFLGILAVQIGFFLALPSVFSLACLILGSITIILQAGFEEARLLARFGKAYQDYMARTPRWLPRLISG